MDEIKVHNIIRWIPFLELVIPEMVETVIDTEPVPSLEQTNFFYDLAEAEIDVKYPNEVLRLIRHFTSEGAVSNLHCHKLRELMEEVLRHDIDREAWTAVVEHIHAAGCVDEANELHRLIEN